MNIEFWKYNAMVHFCYNQLTNTHSFSAYNRKKLCNYTTCTTKPYKITCLLWNMLKLKKSLKRYCNNPYIGVLYSCPKGMAVTTRYNPVGGVLISVFPLTGKGRSWWHDHKTAKSLKPRLRFSVKHRRQSLSRWMTGWF